MKIAFHLHLACFGQPFVINMYFLCDYTPTVQVNGTSKPQ